MSHTQLSQSLETFKQRIETRMRQALTEQNIQNAELHNAMQYSLLLGGKRVRPFLIYATGSMFNANLSDLDACAIAIEAIHTYSLIHDDLPAMDDDNLRRGKPTCHIKFNEAQAILAGDCLQSFAYSVLTDWQYENTTPEQIVSCVRTLSKASNKMCAGQAQDLQSTGLHSLEKPDNQLADLQQMHRLKTGALIEASVKLGAIIGNASREETDILEQYAQKIGLAFQVWDDVLDITSTSDTLGKPQGSDVEASKTTYPSILGLQNAQQKAEQLVVESVQVLQQLPYNTELLQLLAKFIIERDH